MKLSKSDINIALLFLFILIASGTDPVGLAEWLWSLLP